MTDIVPDVEPAPTVPAEAVPVVIMGDATDRAESAQLGAWFTIQFSGTANDQAVRLLPRNRLRKKALVLVVPGDAGNNTGNVWVGTREQAQAHSGGMLLNGMNLEVTAQTETWVNSDGAHSLYVVVHDEWYLPR